MKRAVSISLGSPTRDKCVQIQLNGQLIQVKRIGPGGDEHRARQMFTELDGQGDALSVGGIDLYVRLDSWDYPIRAALSLVKDVHRTSLVDGRVLKYVLERRVFELAAPALGGLPHYRQAFIPSYVARIGLIQAVSGVADEFLTGDLMFYLGIPLAIRGLAQFKRVARISLPVAGFFPLAIFYPLGAKDEPLHPKYTCYWQEADLLTGDLHYIR